MVNKKHLEIVQYILKLEHSILITLRHQKRFYIAYE